MFLIPGSRVKNGDERLVVLNRIAKSVAETCRVKHPTHVFGFEGAPILCILNSG